MKLSPVKLAKNAWKQLPLAIQLGLLLFCLILLVSTAVILLSTTNMMWLKQQLIEAATDFLNESVDKTMEDYAAQLSDEYYERLRINSEYLLLISTQFESVFIAKDDGVLLDNPIPVYWHD